MPQPTVEQIFGPGATRLANGAAAPSAGLFIPDSALVAAGLGSPSTATAEGHLVALCINAKTYLTQAAFDSNIDQSIYVSDGFSNFTTRGTNNDPYRIDQPFVFNLAKIDSGATIDPDNY